MRSWNGRAFAAAIVGGICLASVVHYAGETNDPRFVPSARAQPEPIRRLIDWLRGLTMPAGIVKAEGRIEATQVDVSSKYAGEVVDVAVQEGDKVAAGHVIARLSSPQLEAQLRNAESELKSAKEVRAQDAIKAAEAKVEQIKSMISELMLVSSREGKVQYQLAHAGDSVAAGAPIVTLIDLNDVYMTVFLRAADAGKLATGEEARLILDAAPDYVVPAAVSFVASDLQAAAKAVGTKDNLAKLMLRVDLKIDPKVVETYYGKVETGLRGAGFVRTRPDAKWPAELQVKLPPRARCAGGRTRIRAYRRSLRAGARTRTRSCASHRGSRTSAARAGDCARWRAAIHARSRPRSGRCGAHAAGNQASSSGPALSRSYVYVHPRSGADRAGLHVRAARAGACR